MRSAKINTLSREVLVIGEGNSKNFLSYDPAVSVAQEKIEYSLFLLCKDVVNEIYYLVLKPQSLYLQYENSTFYDAYERTGSDIVSFPEYKNNEKLKVGFLEKKLSYNAIMKEQMNNSNFSNPSINIDGKQFTNIYLFDLNEKNRARVVSSTADPTNQTFVSRWI